MYITSYNTYSPTIAVRKYLRYHGAYVKQTTEFALGWFSWDGQMLDYFERENEDGSYLSAEKWDEIHEVIRTQYIGMPICGWGSPKLRIFSGQLAVMMVSMQCRQS